MAVSDILKNEPVLIAGAVQAVIGLLLAFGIGLSTDQVGAIMAFTAVVIAAIARSKVTPTANVAPVDAP